MEANNRKKSAQLGMNHATAAHQLRKQLLYQLVIQAGSGECYRCGLPIESAEELSLDHKQDWLDVDPALFWDLNNIAFSHAVCNSAAGRKVVVNKKEGPDGTAWCCGHQEFLSVERFQRSKSRPNGLQPYCRDCRSK